jgi:DCN1-like protein 1/2
MPIKVISLNMMLSIDNLNPKDIMDVDGTIQYFKAIELDPEEVAVLAVAYHLDAPSLGVFNRHGFIEGWKNLGCVSPV